MNHPEDMNISVTENEAGAETLGTITVEYDGHTFAATYLPGEPTVDEEKAIITKDGEKVHYWETTKHIPWCVIEAIVAKKDALGWNK